MWRGPGRRSAFRNLPKRRRRAQNPKEKGRASNDRGHPSTLPRGKGGSPLLRDTENLRNEVGRDVGNFINTQRAYRRRHTAVVRLDAGGGHRPNLKYRDKRMYTRVQ